MVFCRWDLGDGQSEVAMIKELRGTLLLSRLSNEQLQRVARRAARLRLDEGQALFSQGDTADRFYLVIRGRMRLFRLSPDGAEKIIEVVEPGQTFAEALMFLDTPRYPVCAAALGKVELISIDARDFARMLRDSVDTCFIMLGALSQRLRSLVREIDNLALHSATCRFARYLLTHRLADGQALELDLAVRKGVIASCLSIKPETFSRIEKDLSKRGVIVVDGQHVIIKNLAALEDLADLGDAWELTPLPCVAKEPG
jgi:CRP-like cAMP-binding protein